ncbi:hypothetical protein CEXT_354281 [Caerostris extrusa]|uniref:Uncharacterized protein n=1 Tax=Caerostris extrusa TaxID=172846 RepID=A0AAV4N7I9_CAEEX|nr:hypothetical protein CEXT_354281 [Caerostris extrusa]
MPRTPLWRHLRPIEISALRQPSTVFGLLYFRKNWDLAGRARWKGCFGRVSESRFGKLRGRGLNFVKAFG